MSIQPISTESRWTKLATTAKEVYKSGMNKAHKAYNLASQVIQEHPRVAKAAIAALLASGLTAAISLRNKRQFAAEFGKHFPGEEKLKQLSSQLGKSFPGFDMFEEMCSRDTSYPDPEMLGEVFLEAPTVIPDLSTKQPEKRSSTQPKAAPIPDPENLEELSSLWGKPYSDFSAEQPIRAISSNLGEASPDALPC